MLLIGPPRTPASWQASRISARVRSTIQGSRIGTNSSMRSGSARAAGVAQSGSSSSSARPIMRSIAGR